MTADRDDLAAILAKHVLVHFYCYNCGAGPFFGDHGKAGDDDHRAHVAQMVLESDWLRGVRAKELREAADAYPFNYRDPLAPGQWQVLCWLRDRADRADNTTDRT